MDTVAILVDGGFYLRRAKALWGEFSAEESAEILHEYCYLHLYHREGGQDVNDSLYRIFYYDCPPMADNVFNPITRKNIAMNKQPLYYG